MARSAAIGRHVDLLGYRVHVAPWLLDELGRIVREAAPAHTIAVITDDDVAQYHAAHVVGSLRHFGGAHRIIYRAVPPGERQKTREQWAALTDWLIDEHCGRDTTIVALGGGVVGDLAGFVAATFMRGVPFVQVPTTLLAMVDASVGGKVAVDTPVGKNLVGAFHQPAAVVIDPTVLQTLPVEHVRAGLAEVIKHGVIRDAGHLERARDVGPRLVAARLEPSQAAFDWHGDELSALITESVEIKAAVVREDERERGLRGILNFGHTIGHAVEIVSGFALRHGEAIAIGMVLEGALAERIGIADAGLRQEIIDALEGAGLPVTLPGAMSAESILTAMRTDKKSREGRAYFALPSAVGVMAGAETGFGVTVDDADVRAVLQPPG
jgi:3-dehydroquinate synthase